jgi:4-hydroxy-3-methylbut-2-enyl diphosphate reductase
VGHGGHQEVIGTTGQAKMELVDERQEWQLPDWGQEPEIAVLTQTTLSVHDTAATVEKIQQKYPNAIVRNDICYATTNRQAAATDLADQTEVVLVIGAQNSSNCNRLKDVAINMGVPAYLINGPQELDPSWIEGVKKIGITSGASTPETQVKAVIESIAPKNIFRVGAGEEKTIFAIPRNLREMVGEGSRRNPETKEDMGTDENN